jgi:hypothetical protein
MAIVCKDIVLISKTNLPAIRNDVGNTHYEVDLE